MNAPQTAEDVVFKRRRHYVRVSRATGCWNWLGTVAPTGYGRVGCQRRYYAAHRVFYEVLRGQVPAGLVLDHLCRNRRCVNPEHLEPVTCAENLARGAGFAATNARKTHCPEGHAYEGHNVIWKTCGGRQRRVCRACSVVYWRSRYQRNREKVLAQKKRYYQANREQKVRYAKTVRDLARRARNEESRNPA